MLERCSTICDSKQTPRASQAPLLLLFHYLILVMALPVMELVSEAVRALWRQFLKGSGGRTPQLLFWSPILLSKGWRCCKKPRKAWWKKWKYRNRAPWFPRQQELGWAAPAWHLLVCTAQSWWGCPQLVVLAVTCPPSASPGQVKTCWLKRTPKYTSSITMVGLQALVFSNASSRWNPTSLASLSSCVF